MGKRMNCRRFLQFSAGTATLTTLAMAGSLEALSLATAHATAATTTISEPTMGIKVTVDTSGSYTISVLSPTWTFGGNIGHTLSNVAVNSGTDALGHYKEITFHYQGNVARSSGIRIYRSRSVVLFSTTYLATASNSEPFPHFTSYPKNLYHLSHNGTFGAYDFHRLRLDSPWLFFDGQANSFILSPAANFLVAYTMMQNDGSIAGTIRSDISSLPQNFTHKVMLAIGKGINKNYITWGHAMTDLQGKVRPANDADVSLNMLGYWTDNGAAYYYSFDRSKGYRGTLEAIKSEFDSKGITLGYMQIDSWWYPKGSTAAWDAQKAGEYTYTADKTLFPDGLSAFQQKIGLPLITHGRWIDHSSPYRSEYTISNNVSTDPKFWKTIMSYLKRCGVMTYEQDWLSMYASPTYNLTDPYAFLDNMASAAKENGMTMQYCMASPRHYMQGTMYNNLTTMRVSMDRFMRSHWDEFLYDLRLGSALGTWPWSDVFMSTELDNLLLSTLSGSMVGVGDALGQVNKTNLMYTIRPDGVIVKPDTSIVPTDETYVGEAKGLMPAMVAYAVTDHGNLKYAYVFAYKRSFGSTQQATFTPNKLGIAGQTYVYNYFTKTGQLVNAGRSFSDTVGDGSYYIVTPVGKSGIAFLGDTDKFVSLGRKRISQLADNGTIQATIAFARNEGAITLSGYAPSQPKVSASNGSVGTVSYSATTSLFNITVKQGSDNAASITITCKKTKKRKTRVHTN